MVFAPSFLVEAGSLNLGQLANSSQAILKNIPFVAIVLVIYLTEQVGFWQKKMYKRYLFDGFTRADILGYQLFSLVLRFFISILLVFCTLGIIGVVVKFDLLIEILKTFDYFWLALLFCSFLLKGFVVLLLMNTLKRFQVILVYIGWIIAEQLIGGVKAELFPYLPYNLMGLIQDLMVSKLDWIQLVLLGILFVGASVGLVYQAKRNEY